MSDSEREDEGGTESIFVRREHRNEDNDDGNEMPNVRFRILPAAENPVRNRTPVHEFIGQGVKEVAEIFSRTN